MIPIEFLRQFRIFDYAIFDFLVSFLGIYFLAPVLSKIFLRFKVIIPRNNWLFLTLPLGIFFHLIFGRITPLTRDFISLDSHYILKVLILVSLLLGLRGISRKKS